MSETETLRDKLFAALCAGGEEQTYDHEGHDAVVDDLLPVVEEHTRLAVEKALVEQREAIHQLIAFDAAWLREAYESTETRSPQERRDYMLRMLATEDAAASIRDFSKEAVTNG